MEERTSLHLNNNPTQKGPCSGHQSSQVCRAAGAWVWCLLSTLTHEASQGLGHQGCAEDRGNARTGLRVKTVACAGHRRKGNCSLATHTFIPLLPARGTAWCHICIVLEICPQHWKTRRVQREIWMFGSSQKHLLTLGPQTQGSWVPRPQHPLASPHSHCTRPALEPPQHMLLSTDLKLWTLPLPTRPLSSLG